MLGITLKNRYFTAVVERNKHIEAHRGFSATLGQNDIDKWEQIAIDWDRDFSFPKQAFNPFELVGDGECARLRV